MTKKIIDGKVYDTETATKVASRYRTQLFITKKGAWFFYEDDTGDIQSADAKKAYDWLYRYSKADEIKVYFPGSIEDA